MFVPLHVKSDYSLGYGTASVDELAAGAAELGYRSLALTDLENLFGQVRFHHQCRRRGLQPLTGIELRPAFDGKRQLGRRAGRVVLLAADGAGYRSLCRIVSRRGAGGHQLKATLGEETLPLIHEHPEGLFALSDDPPLLERLLTAGVFPRERLGLLLPRPVEPAADQGRQAAAARLGVPLIADLDAVFLQPADHALHALQVAIHQKRLLSEVVSGDELESRERWLRSPAEAEDLFADVPQAVTAATAIAQACHLELGVGEEAAAFFGNGEAAAKLRLLCRQALAANSLEQSWTPRHGQKLEEELAAFENLGFSDFMVVVAEILGHCRCQGIPVVVRGSAVSSVALYLLGGSPVDPLAHGLLFERFLHPGKSSWPDVDIDLPWHRREEVIAWAYRHFGRGRVATVAAHHTFRYRSALREGLKAWGARPDLLETLSRALPPEDLPIEDIDFLGLAANAGEGEPMTDLSPETAGLGVILPLIQRLVGRARHIAAHPGGLVVGRCSLEDLLPLERAPRGLVITQYDLVSLEHLGLAKIDLLGNRCLSEIEETFALAGYPQPLCLESIPLDDPSTLALIDRAETLGCFQLESPAMRSLLARLPIQAHSDLVAALALIRPGAAAGEAKSAFIRRARGEETETSPFPGMADRLGETHGLLLYEEDIMLLLSRIGGLSLGEADELRAAIVASGGDTDSLAELKARFLATASRLAGDTTHGRQAWAAAARFAAYSFNKAHAASYGRLAYLSAYAKAHHPLEFACALLNHHQGLYPLRTLAGEFIRLGVELRAPHVLASGFRSQVEERASRQGPGAIRVGLDKIRHLSRRATGEIIQERGRAPFRTLKNLLERVTLSRREITVLVLAGACDGLSPLDAADYPFAHDAVVELLGQGGDRAELDILPIPRPADSGSPRVRLYQSLVRVRNELRFLQMSLWAHPLALLRPEASRYGCRPLRETTDMAAGALLRLAVTIAAMRRVATRQGPVLFMTLEDETGLLEAVVPAAAYRRLAGQVGTPGPFLVAGKLRRRQGAVHLEVNFLSPFHERQRPFASGM